MITHDEPSPSRRALLRTASIAAAAVAVGSTRSRTTTAAAPATATTAIARVHRIMSCNILLDLPEHEGTPLEWAAQRRDACEDLIRAQHADVLCLQEVGRAQNDDFGRAFPTFTPFGYDDPYVDRRPKRFQSIKNVILFSAERYDLLTGGAYWLSATPWLAGSRFPDEGLPRHVTWVRLRDRATGRHFRVLNTHWGLKSPMRLQQAPVIATETQLYAPDSPQLLCGDYNSIATSAEQPILLDAGWSDTFAAVHGDDDDHASRATTAPTSTFTTTAPTTAPTSRGRIDFVFFRGAVKPVAAAYPIRPGDSQRPASDHPFISADVLI
jgi:endonuclease/exonuclease/phosphatase family metal-dependent hydrolase